MSLNVSRCDRAILDSLMTRSGASVWGVASAGAVSPGQLAVFDRWIESGKNASMAYLEKYHDLRVEPSGLLPGVKSVIVAAFAYPTSPITAGMPRWAGYALGDDYHDVIRARLSEVAEELISRFDCHCRVCVDTAPLPERYWAVMAGVGFVGRHSQLIVPGRGSRFFLAEILTTLSIKADEPCRLGCDDCKACIQACPGGAICSDGTVDARRCNSFLTIENRDAIPPEADLHGFVYGCDICQEVCPHNVGVNNEILPEFTPRQDILNLTFGQLCKMTQTEFSTIFRRNAIKRTKLTGLVRNVNFVLKCKDSQESNKIVSEL